MTETNQGLVTSYADAPTLTITAGGVTRRVRPEDAGVPRLTVGVSR